MKSIAEELENREVPLCVVCKENPAREWCDTCSTECNKLKWLMSEKNKIYRRIYQKALIKLKYLHQDEFNKIKEDLK